MVNKIEIILNEKKFVEDMMEEGKTEKPVLAINLLAKYYRQVKNISGNKLYDAINDFMKMVIPDMILQDGLKQ